MTTRKIIALLIAVITTFAFITTAAAADKVKFNKKKLKTTELIDAPARLDPMLMPRQAPETVTIFGDPEATQNQMVKYILSNNPKPLLNCTVRQIVQLYYEEAGLEGIRPDVALCQALKETGFFAYGGDVDPSQNNYCGLGATGNHEPGLKFESPQIGVRAHIQHLLAYTSTNPPKLELVDPRYILVKENRKDIFGKTKHWVELNGRWAVPGKQYGQDILRRWQAAQMPDASDESLAAANRNIKLSAPTADMFVYRGMVYFAREDYYKALEDFESALILAPQSAEAMYDLAITYEKINRKKDAIEAYDKLLELNNTIAEAFYNRGRLKLLQGEYEAAIEDFNRVLVIEDRFADAQNEIAVAYFRMKEYETAYDSINRAYGINDRNETVLANKAALDSCVKVKKVKNKK